MKLMKLMCGLPGSGKSFKSAEIVSAAQQSGKTAIICSTDDFFIVDGVYKFNPKLLGVNHNLNRAKAQQACKDGIDLVVIDNTNILAKHREEYEKIAAEFGYEVEVLVIGEFTSDFAKMCAERNQHGVGFESILKMARQVELP